MTHVGSETIEDTVSIVPTANEILHSLFWLSEISQSSIPFVSDSKSQ